MEGIKGAIFDLDGTLFDSLWVWQEIDKRFLSRRGIEVPSDYAEKIGAMNFLRSAEYTIERFGLKETPEELMGEWMDMSRKIYAEEIKLKPLAKDFLLALKSKGIKLAVATSSVKELYMPALLSNKIADLFDHIADTSHSRGKDFSDVYLEAARHLGLEPRECAVFEDLPTALRSAHEGGFVTVAVCDRHTKIGEDMRECINLCVNDFGELIKYL